jgi:hypothetical protein
MFYIIPDTLLTVSLNTNKTDRHDIHVTEILLNTEVVLNTIKQTDKHSRQK